MSLSHPELLWLFLAPVGALLLRRRMRTRVPMPFDHAVPSDSVRRECLLDAFDATPLLLLAVAVLVLAGPERSEAAPARRRMTNIEICLDVSGSMNFAFDGERTRFDVAMAALREFTEAREGDAVGLTVFGESVLHWLPLTQHLECLANAAPFVAPGRLSVERFSGTAVANALRACRDHLIEREEGDRVIILISDGASDDLKDGGAEAVAAELSAAGIATYVVHVAHYTVPLTSRIVADATGGHAFAAGDPAGLEAIFRRIDAMQPMQPESARRERVRDFRWTGWAGLAVGLLFALHSLRWRYTPW